MAVTIDHDRLVDAYEALIPRLAAEIRNAPDPDAIAVGRWTVRELSAHLVDVFTRYPKLIQTSRSVTADVDSVGDVNEAGLQPHLTKDAATMASEVEVQGAKVIPLLRDKGPTEMVPWAEHIIVPMSSIAALGVGECLVHGYDLAQASGRSWDIDPKDVGLMLAGIAPFLPHYVDQSAAAGFTGTYELRLRRGPRLRLAFLDGVLTVSDPDGGKVDCIISADPVSYLLVGYGRRSQWGPMLAGKLMAYGRKPWLGFKLASMLRNP